MPKALTQSAVDAFHKNGFHFPIRVFTEDETRLYRTLLEDFEAEFAEQAAGLRTDLHIIKKWAYELVTNNKILDPVEDILGPNILLWGLNWFIKEPGEKKIVTMHQDSNYWGLEPYDVITAWVGLSDATEKTGPMKFLRGSHHWKTYDHEDTFDAGNLLSRGQKIIEPLNESQAVLAPLSAGEMSLHHVRIIHGSSANLTDDRRIGMVLRFIAPNVRQTVMRDTATLVRGKDSFGHFDLLPPPDQDMGDAEVARHKDAVDRLTRIIHAKDYV